MTESTHALLRRLLPRYFWLRDAEEGGGALDAVVSVVAEGYDALRLDLDRLYDDLFIDTCDPRQIPLIGAGVGVLGLSPAHGPGVGDRAWVGRVIGLRRRKGMTATVSRGIGAATGWAAYVQEGREVVAATWSADGPPAGGGYLDLSGRSVAADLRAPWSQAPRSVSLSGRPVAPGAPPPRAPAPAAGSPVPTGAAVYVWRLAGYPVRGRTARAADDAPAAVAGRAFRFDPLGRDIRLFAHPAATIDGWDASRVDGLPLPLTVALLADALDAGRPPVHVEHGERLVAGDLRDWRSGRHAAGAAVVDPLRGRLLLAEPRERPPAVGYAYGFPGELGGGPYGTAGDYASLPADGGTVRVGPGAARTLEGALQEAAGARRAVVIDDSATYVAPGGLWGMRIPAGCELRIASAPDAAPVLDGSLEVQVEHGARLELSGITLTGTLALAGAGEVSVEHATLAPRPRHPSLRAAGEVAVALSFAIAGGVEAGRDADLAAHDTIIDGALTAAGVADLARATVLGRVRAATLLAEDCLFVAPVEADAGTAVTSYLPEGSSLPERRDCPTPRVGRPRLVSTRWGAEAYCQLDLRGPLAIATGGSGGGELGAYHWLGQAERFARVPIVLDELLPAGVSASLHYLS